MNCTTEEQHYKAARNLQAERLESLSSPSFLRRALVDIRYVMRAIVKLITAQLPVRKPKYRRTSSLRFH